MSGQLSDICIVNLLIFNFYFFCEKFALRYILGGNAKNAKT